VGNEQFILSRKTSKESFGKSAVNVKEENM
jgi:hypothetical protein